MFRVSKFAVSAALLAAICAGAITTTVRAQHSGQRIRVYRGNESYNRYYDSKGKAKTHSWNGNWSYNQAQKYNQQINKRRNWSH